MSCQTGLESSKLHKGKDDSTKVINIDYKKVGHLDLEVLCSICQEEVHISQLFHHKKTHQAQAVLDYQRPWVEPIDMKQIALQRKKLILRTRMAKYPEREREKIGCAVDLLKESLKITPYFCIKSEAQSSVHIKEVSNPLIKAIAVCQDKNAIWNMDLEDVFVVLDNYGNKKGTCLLGLFDGSNGISAAQTTSAELPLLLLDQLSHGDLSYQLSQAEKEVLDSYRTVFRADYIVREKIFTFKRVQGKKLQRNKYEWIHRAYAKSFWRMDRLLRLGRNEVSRVCWSSCTAAICLVEKISNEKQEQEDTVGGETSEKIPNEKDENNKRDEEQEVPERIRAKKRSCTEQGAGRGPEQEREEPLERIHDKEEQNIVEEMEKPLERIHDEKEQNIVEEMEKPIERIHDEKEQNIVEEMEKPLKKIKDEKEQNIIEQGEDALERINDEKEQKIIEQGEDALERINDEKEQNIIEQKEDHLERISDEKEQIIEQREEPTEIINEKEWNVIEQRENLFEGIKAEKEQDFIEQKEESVEIINDKKEQNLIQEEQQMPERKSRAKEKSITGSGTGSIMEQQQEEPLETLNDGKENNIGDNKQTADNKGIKEGSLLENDHSSDEVSVGLMHIANIGNVHAVLCKNGKSYWLTKEHTTYSREEKIRVFRKGGYISSNEPKGLIEGLTKNTRGLGHHGKPKLKRNVIPVPHTISFPIDDSCQFLILASNGLWEVLDKSEVVLLTLTMFSAYLEKYQDTQLKKRRASNDSKLPLDDLECKFYSWYLNQDIFPEKDAVQNLSQSNAQLSPPTNSINEKVVIKSDSFSKSSEQEPASSLESTLSSVTSSSEDTETRPSRAGTEESPKESQMFGQSTEELAPESHESLQTSEDIETNSWTFYALAAKYISKHLVKAALKAGSRDNITVLVALLNGCDKIPTYVQNV